MNKLIILMMLSPILLSSGCFTWSGSSSEKIIGGYKVMWIEGQVKQFICHEADENSGDCVPVVPDYVFGVGHNNKFIIAKQHPSSGFYNGFEIDRSVTNYYIINVNGGVTPDGEQVIGPLTREQFDKKRKELNIQNIQFEIIYPETPWLN